MSGWWGVAILKGTPAACPLRGAFALYGKFLLHMHICSSDLMKATAPLEGNWIIALFKSPYYTPPATNLVEWGA